MSSLNGVSRENGLSERTYSTRPYDKKKCKKVELPQNHFVWGSERENKRHYILGSLFDRNGCFSRIGTRNLIKDLESFDPDVIHLHNLHKFCINFPILFKYLKESNKKVVWTLHDCWAFTGHCPHFDMIGCEKWKTFCYKCPQFKSYPKSYIDRSRSMYKLKKKWFTGVENMTLVTPSKWLADLAKQSFLKDYPIQVINNGIDLSIFKPTLLETKSDVISNLMQGYFFV